ncbi:MAG: hypothetical protein SangKO_076030 [Sandaracinaceae bacterium]
MGQDEGVDAGVPELARENPSNVVAGRLGMHGRAAVDEDVGAVRALDQSAVALSGVDRKHAELAAHGGGLGLLVPAPILEFRRRCAVWRRCFCAGRGRTAWLASRTSAPHESDN